jgi:hypothetical protein
MAALAKLSLLFLGGVFIGLVVPLGLAPSKLTPADDARPSAERTLTLRCIVEYRSGQLCRTGFGGRTLPRPTDDPPALNPDLPVEIVVHPNGEKAAASSDGVTVILRVYPNACAPDAPPAPPERPMPDAM